MKVHELLEKKLDEMNVEDYTRLAEGLAAQGAIVLKMAGLKSLADIDKDVLTDIVLDQQIVQMDNAGRVYCIAADMTVIRERLAGKAGT
jgi:ethanolamine transporter EutH